GRRRRPAGGGPGPRRAVAPAPPAGPGEAVAPASLLAGRSSGLSDCPAGHRRRAGGAETVGPAEAVRPTGPGDPAAVGAGRDGPAARVADGGAHCRGRRAAHSGGRGAGDLVRDFLTWACASLTINSST